MLFRSYSFASARVSQTSRAWMAQLPATMQFRFAGTTFRVIHGGVSQTNKFVFASETEVLAAEAQAAGADVVIAGHCGLPFVAKAGRRVWFNPGVIGMPANDGAATVWFGLISAAGDGLKLETRRLAYDHAAAAATLRRSGHANSYARTLLTGLWPSLDSLPETERRATGIRFTPRTLRRKATARTLSAAG